jgi:hypothetical protein
MGIRIDAHAVDTAAFEVFLDRPLWSVLVELRRRAPADAEPLFSADDAPQKQRYVVLPNRRAIVRVGPSSLREELSDEQLADVPLLRQDLRTHLRAESSYALLFLIRALPWLMPNAHAEITRGFRRWWIDSVLAATRSGACADVPGLPELEGFFGRMLRVYGSDLPLPQHHAMPPAGSFPVVPSDDTDMWMAVFSEAEGRRFGTLAGELLQRGCAFGAPPGHSFQDADPVEWHEHVTEMLGRFSRLGDLPLPNLRLVTFIG